MMHTGKLKSNILNYKGNVIDQVDRVFSCIGKGVGAEMNSICHLFENVFGFRPKMQ